MYKYNVNIKEILSVLCRKNIMRLASMYAIYMDAAVAYHNIFYSIIPKIPT